LEKLQACFSSAGFTNRETGQIAMAFAKKQVVKGDFAC
jgi:hypothetical protein